MRQFEEFLDRNAARPAATTLKGIFGDKVGPVRGQGAQMAGIVMKPRPVLSPVQTTLDQIKFPAEQRMMRVRYPKRSALNVTMRRS